jgi:hypothetical protein
LRQMCWTIEQSKDWFSYLNVSFDQSTNCISSSTDSVTPTSSSSISLSFVRNEQKSTWRNFTLISLSNQAQRKQMAASFDWPDWLVAKHLQKQNWEGVFLISQISQISDI